MAQWPVFADTKAGTAHAVPALVQTQRRLTSNDDASSGGASDGGGASPNAGDATPSAFGPSALLLA